MARYAIEPDRSTVVVEARSSVGPIVWEGLGPTGEFDVVVADGTVDLAAPVSGWLELRVDQLTSGNRVYDAELLRRVDARQHPSARVALTAAAPGGPPGAVSANGTIEFHGVTHPVAGDLEVEVLDPDRVMVTGAQQLDIRDFGLPAPTMLVLKVFPDVRVHLVVEGVRLRS